MMSTPVLLDLFSGAGGAARGYQMAGFRVVGVDIKAQPRYAGDEFHQADALAFVAAHGHEFDAIHASPPCLAYSEANPLAHRATAPDLIAATRDALLAVGRPYAIENVENARRHLVNPVMLCGTMFGLSVWRHRYFELWPIWCLAPATCRHEGRPICIHPGSNARKGRGHTLAAVGAAAMGVKWMSREEVRDAVPPRYCEFIGSQLLAALANQKAA